MNEAILKQNKPEYRAERSKLLRERIRKRVLVLDGATGTALQDANLTAKDFGGEALEGCNENLVLTRPDVIKKVHTDYLAAGADIVETDTFGGVPFVLGEYGLSEKAYEINKRACEIAREACAEFSTADWPRFVAGSIGPTTKAIGLESSAPSHGCSVKSSESFPLEKLFGLLSIHKSMKRERVDC